MQTDSSETTMQSFLSAHPMVHITSLLKAVKNKTSYHEIFFHLNMHILSGEYITWLPYSEDTINNFIELCKNEEQITKSLLALKWLLSNIDAELSEKTYHIIGGEYQPTYTPNGNIPGNQAQIIEMFFLNCAVAFTDHFYMNEHISVLVTILQDRHRELNKIRIDVWEKNNIKTEAISDDVVNDLYHLSIASVEKVNFLIRKALLAFEESNITRSHNSMPAVELIRLDNYQQILDSKDHELYFLYDALKESKNHYGLPPYGRVEDVRAKLREKLADINESITLNEYHHAIKWYRDIRGDFSSLEKLQNRFENELKIKLSRQVSVMDKRAYVTAGKFLEDAKLRVYLKSHPKVNDAIKYYRENREKMNSHYFYQHKSISEYLCETKETWLNYADINGLWECHELWSTASYAWKRNIIEAIDHNFSPYYLPFNECVFKTSYKVDKGTYITTHEKNAPLKVRNEALDIFIASFYMQPFDAAILEIQYQINRKEYQDTQTKAIRRSAETVANMTENRIRGMQDNAIQILGIFIAIVTFMAGMIGLGKEIKNANEVLRFAAVFGICMILFVIIFSQFLGKIRVPSPLASGAMSEETRRSLLYNNVTAIILALIFVGLCVFMYFFPLDQN